MHSPLAVTSYLLSLHRISYDVYDDFCLLYSEWEEINEVLVSLCKIRVDMSID